MRIERSPIKVVGSRIRHLDTTALVGHGSVSIPDPIALLKAIRDVVRTSEGRRLLGEMAAEVRRVLDADDSADPVAAEAARLLARARRRDRHRNRRPR